MSEGEALVTRIVFDNGLEVTVAQDEADVGYAVRRDHPNPVTVEGSTGRPLHINWEHVALIEETVGGPPSSK